MRARYLLFILLVAVPAAACSRSSPPETETPVAVLRQGTVEETVTVAEVLSPLPTRTAVAAKSVTPVTMTPLPPIVPQDAIPTTTPAPSPSLAVTPMPLPLPEAEEVTFELIAQEGGNVRSVAVNGNVAFVGVGPRLVALNVTDPTQPRPIGRSEVLPGLVDAVVLVDMGERVLAYVAAGQQALALAIDPNGVMTVEDAVAMPGYTSALILEEGVLYAGGRVPGGSGADAGFIAALDVRQPRTLRMLYAMDLPGRVSALTLAEDVLYVGHQHGLSAILIEAGRLSDPLRLGGVRDVSSLQAVGETLLVGGYMQLYALDISARTKTGYPHASQLWRIDASPELFLPIVKGIAVVNDTIYTVGNIPAGAYIPSRLAFPAPEPLADLAGPPSSPLVALRGHNLFVTEGDLLEIYDIGRSEAPVQVGIYDPSPSSVSALAIHQPESGSEILYLYEGNAFNADPHQVLTFHLPDLEPLGRLSIEPIEAQTIVGQGALFDLALDGNLAYAVVRDGVYEIDISDPAVPQFVARYPFAEPWFEPRGILSLGDRVYLGKEMNLGLQIDALSFDGADPATQVDTLAGLAGDHLSALAGSADRLYAVTAAYPDQGWLHIIDVSGDMELVETLPLPAYPENVIATDGTLVATAMAEQLVLIDVSLPDQPQMVATATLPESFEPFQTTDDLVFHEELLFATNGAQLLAIDVSIPAHPLALGVATLPSSFSSTSTLFALSGNTVAVANGPMGIMVFAVSQEVNSETVE